MNTNLDDWETDPDFVRDMDEMDQRWGSRRTVGSINMGKLIDDVQRDHKTIHESNDHSSQKNYTSGLDRNARPQVSQKTFSRRVITEKSERTFYEDSTVSSKEPEKKVIVENTSTSYKSNPNLAPKPDLSDITSRLYKSTSHSTNPDPSLFNNIWTESPKQFKDSATTKRIFEERISASSPSSRPVPAAFNSASRPSTGSGAASTPAFKSIQDKIDAFKREFDQIESKVAKKSDISKVIKKSTNTGKFDDTVEYVTRSSEKLDQQKRQPQQQQRATTTSPTEKNKSYSSSSGFRPSSTSPLHDIKKSGPESSIKSLSEKFESMGRETSEDFRRRMDERRREFFDEIKSQVRETRKGLDGFDINDSDQEESRAEFTKRHERDQTSGTMPKVYSRRETTQEKVVSKFVRENDKVIHDETRRNVERTSSCHGSSEDELDNEPASIKQLNRSYQIPVQKTGSPIDPIKSKTPPMDFKNKSSGLMARTLYDYRAAEDDELTFDIDDLITNIEKIDEGWYKGTMVRNGQKKVGLFPANYVKLLNDSSFY